MYIKIATNVTYVCLAHFTRSPIKKVKLEERRRGRMRGGLCGILPRGLVRWRATQWASFTQGLARRPNITRTRDYSHKARYPQQQPSWGFPRSWSKVTRSQGRVHPRPAQTPPPLGGQDSRASAAGICIGDAPGPSSVGWEDPDVGVCGDGGAAPRVLGGPKELEVS